MWLYNETRSGIIIYYEYEVSKCINSDDCGEWTIWVQIEIEH